MLEFGEMLLEYYGDYSNPAMKITRVLEEGNLIRLKNGLYETNGIKDRFHIAQALYGPSYISFDTALSFYGIIPEYAFNVSNATLLKHKNKSFKTEKCTYYYSDVPATVFPYCVKTINDEGYVYRLATREKAVCDKLYKMPPMEDSDELKVLMFDDLRFDEDDIAELDYSTVSELSELYGCRNVRLFSDYLGAL